MGGSEIQVFHQGFSLVENNPQPLYLRSDPTNLDDTGLRPAWKEEEKARRFLRSLLNLMQFIYLKLKSCLKSLALEQFCKAYSFCLICALRAQIIKYSASNAAVVNSNWHLGYVPVTLRVTVRARYVWVTVHGSG